MSAPHNPDQSIQMRQKKHVERFVERSATGSVPPLLIDQVEQEA